MIEKMMATALALALASPAAAQSSIDPFAAMTPAGRAKATALNAQIDADFDSRVERMVAVRTHLIDLLKAQPQDMKAIREAAKQYEDGLLANLGDWTVAWVDLAATLEPADRAIILARLPRSGGVFRAPPPPPRPPAGWSGNAIFKATPKAPAPITK